MNDSPQVASEVPYEAAVRAVHKDAHGFKPVHKILPGRIIGWTFAITKIGETEEYGWMAADFRISHDRSWLRSQSAKSLCDYDKASRQLKNEGKSGASDAPR